MRTLALLMALGASTGCVRTRIVTVPVKTYEPCLKDLGAPPDVPDLDALVFKEIVDAYDDMTLYARRAWAKCGGVE